MYSHSVLFVVTEVCGTVKEMCPDTKKSEAFLYFTGEFTLIHVTSVSCVCSFFNAHLPMIACLCRTDIVNDTKSLV